MPQAVFSNRTSAARQLAELVFQQWHCPRDRSYAKKVPIVYALPCGGIPIALPIAQKLHCSIEAIAAKKISLPHNREVAIGAVNSQNEVVWNKSPLLPILDTVTLDLVVSKAKEKAQYQQLLFDYYQPPIDPQDRIAILVDDGIATGMSVCLAAQTLRQRQVAQIWLCAPVAPKSLLNKLERWCDRLIILHTPKLFFSVSCYYRNFPQIEMSTALKAFQLYHQFHNKLLLFGQNGIGLHPRYAIAKKQRS